MWQTLLSFGGKTLGSVTGNWKVYVIGLLLVAGTSSTAYFALQIASKNSTIGTLTADNVQLAADKITLKNNYSTLKSIMDSNELERLRLQGLADVANAELIKLRKTREESYKRELELETALSKFKEDENSEEAKVLEVTLPDTLIDAWNADGMFDVPQSVLPTDT